MCTELTHILSNQALIQNDNLESFRLLVSSIASLPQNRTALVMVTLSVPIVNLSPSEQLIWFSHSFLGHFLRMDRLQGVFCSRSRKVTLATHSYHRSRINGDVGARTQMASIVCSVIVLLTTFFLLPSLYYLPKCVLASM
jgi:Sulfate permease family